MCVSLFLSVLFGSQGTWTFLLSCLEEREQAGGPASASQGCSGLQIQESNHGKPRLSGAADLDKSFILYCAFLYEVGTYETSFLLLDHRVPPFSRTRELFPGLELGRSCGDKEINEGPNSTSPLPPPRA